MYHNLNMFDEFKSTAHSRGDCQDRYNAIKQYMCYFVGKSLIDICCAEGFFMFQFVLDGGKLARGVECDDNKIEITKYAAKKYNIDVDVQKTLDGLGKFDFGIYLDSHYGTDTQQCGYLEFIRDNVPISFISCCRSGAEDQFIQILKAMWNQVTPIYKGYAGRTIFMVKDKK